MGLFVRKNRDGTVFVSADKDHTRPPPKRHHFARRWVNRNLVDGTVLLSEGKLTVGSVMYKVLRAPGAYCDHCGDRIGEGPARTAEEADLRRKYVETCAAFKSKKKTGDPNNPAGYTVIGYYDCELEE